MSAKRRVSLCKSGILQEEFTVAFCFLEECRVNSGWWLDKSLDVEVTFIALYPKNYVTTNCDTKYILRETLCHQNYVFYQHKKEILLMKGYTKFSYKILFTCSNTITASV